MVCSNCGSSNPETNRFCGQCGAQLPPAETPSVPAGPVSSAFREEVEKQQYQLRQLQRRAEDTGRVASETNAMPEAGRRATDRKAEPEPATMVDAEAREWGSEGLSDEPAWQSSQQANFDDTTIVGDPHRDTQPATAYAPFDRETGVIGTRQLPDETATEREYAEPPISGPSFLGLGQTESESSNLAYLYEDEPRPGRARYWIAALIVLACVGFIAYQWKQHWNWDTTIIGQHKAQQADAGKPGGETDAKANAPEPGNGQSNEASGAAAQGAAGAQAAPAVQGDAGATSTTSADKSTSGTSLGGTPPEQSPAPGQSQTAGAKGKKPDVPADQGKTSSKESKKATVHGGKSGAAEQNSAEAADEGASAGEDENGGDEVAEATPPKPSKLAQTKPRTSREAEKEPGSDLVAKADKYLYGRGVSKNCDQALVYLRTAANHGNAQARSKLGALYATGHCVSMDRAEAYNWFTLARDAGSKSVWVERNREMLWSQMTPAEKERTLGP